MSHAYEWGLTYVLTRADLDRSIRFAVTATNAAGTSTAASFATAVVGEAQPPVNVIRPSIGGTLEDGRALSSRTGTWTGAAPSTYARRWQRCDATGAAWADLPATAATYKLVAADVGATLRLAVTATNAAGDTTAVTRAIGARRRPAARRVSIGPEAPLRGRRLAVTLACADGPARCGGTLSVGEPAMPVSVPAGEALTVVLRVPRRTAGEVAARFTSDGRASGRFTAATINVT